MTDEDDGGLVHISTRTMTTMGPDGPNGGGMTHVCWSTRSLEELVTHYTAVLGADPDWKDGKAVFVQTNEGDRATEESVTVVEEALGHREAPPRAASVVTLINTTTMRRVEPRASRPKPRFEPPRSQQSDPPHKRWWRRLK